MAEHEQKAARDHLKKNAKPKRLKRDGTRRAPHAEATAVGRKLFDHEVQNFIGLLGAKGLSQKQFCSRMIGTCRASSSPDQKSDNVENALRQLQYILARSRKLNAPLAADYAKTLNITIKQFDEALRQKPSAPAMVSDVDRINDGFVKYKIPGPIVTAVFPQKSLSEQLRIQKKIVMFLKQLTYLGRSWADLQEHGVLSKEDWDQRLIWYKNAVWTNWIRKDPELLLVNDHVIATEDFQSRQFGLFYKQVITDWKRETAEC